MNRPLLLRVALFALCFLGVVLWVESCAQGDDALGRSFLRNLLRTLF